MATGSRRHGRPGKAKTNFVAALRWVHGDTTCEYCGTIVKASAVPGFDANLGHLRKCRGAAHHTPTPES